MAGRHVTHVEHDKALHDALNIDADTVDGQHASAFSLISHDHDSDYAPTSHGHNDQYYTEAEIDTQMSGKANTVHNHDSIYYTESEINTLLSGKSDTGHTHSYAPLSHTHVIGDITGFAEAVSDQVGTMVTGNTEAGISVVYQDTDNTLDFTIAYGTVVQLDGTLSSGSGNTAARANHKHSITKAAIDALNVDADTLDGIDSTGFAIATHNHDADYATDTHVHPSSYSTTIGNGSAVEINVTHNLGTTDVIVQFQDLVVGAGVDALYETVDANTIRAVFNEAPATNEVRVLVLAAEDVAANANVVTSDDVTRIVVLTQTEYDALGTPDGNTLYVVDG